MLSVNRANAMPSGNIHAQLLRSEHNAVISTLLRIFSLRLYFCVTEYECRPKLNGARSHLLPSSDNIVIFTTRRRIDVAVLIS